MSQPLPMLPSHGFPVESKIDLLRKWCWNTWLEDSSPPPFKPSDIPGLQLWVEADRSVLSSVSPDVPATYNQGVRNWKDLSGLGNDAGQPTGGSQPKYLSWNGTNYARMPGVAGNYLSTTGVRPTTSFRVEANLSAPIAVYTTGSHGVSGVWNATTANRGWIFSFQNGKMQANIAVTGGGASTALISTISLPFTDWQTVWVACDVNITSGTCDFSTSTDGINWTAFGSRVTFSPQTVYASAAKLEIGSSDSGTGNLFEGKMTSCSITIDGSLYASFKASQGNANSSSTTDAQGNVWTINRSGADPAGIVSFPCLRFDGVDDSLDLSTGFGMFNNVGGATILISTRMPTVSTTNLGVFGASTATATSTRAGIFGQSITSVGLGGRRNDADSLQAVSGTATATQFNVIAGAFDYANAAANVYLNGTSIASSSSFLTSGNTSATNSAAISIGRSGASSARGNCDISGLLVYNRLLTSAERLSAARYIAGLTNGMISF